MQDAGCRVQGAGCRVQGAWLLRALLPRFASRVGVYGVGLGMGLRFYVWV